MVKAPRPHHPPPPSHPPPPGNLINRSKALILLWFIRFHFCVHAYFLRNISNILLIVICFNFPCMLSWGLGLNQFYSRESSTNKQVISVTHFVTWSCPAGTWRLYNVVLTSMQRHAWHDVASTLMRALTFIQLRINVDAMSWSYSEVNATLYIRHVSAGCYVFVSMRWCSWEPNRRLSKSIIKQFWQRFCWSSYLLCSACCY